MPILRSAGGSDAAFVTKQLPLHLTGGVKHGGLEIRAVSLATMPMWQVAGGFLSVKFNAKQLIVGLRW